MNRLESRALCRQVPLRNHRYECVVGRARASSSSPAPRSPRGASRFGELYRLTSSALCCGNARRRALPVRSSRFRIITARVAEAVGRHARGQLRGVRLRIPLFFREERLPVGHDETHVARAGLIEARIVDLVQDPVTGGEPDTAGGTECRADGALPAGRPARRDAGPAGCKRKFGLSRRGDLLMPLKSLREPCSR